MKPKLVYKKCNTANFDSRGGCDIKKIVIHYTGDKGATAKNELDYFAREKTGTSAHYFVDDKIIAHSVKNRDRAWHCGLGGGTFESSHHPKYGIVTNSNSIGIEVCVDKKGHIKYETYKNVCKLVQWLMALYNIEGKNVVRHYDVTGKACPNAKTINKSGKVSRTTLLNNRHWKAWRKKVCHKKYK